MHKQSGNALFLILIAVALFAALSYAITQSGRGGGNISREKAAIAASQITQYGAALHSAVQRMIISGVPVDDQHYEKPGSTVDGYYCGPAGAVTDKSRCVFYPEGGSMIWECPTEDQVDMSVDSDNSGARLHIWRFRDIHSQDSNGFYIKDVGTNTDGTGRDTFAYLRYVHLSVCQQINKGLGLDETPADNSNYADNYAATYDLNANVMYAAPGAPFACVDSGGYYSYYHALVEQ